VNIIARSVSLTQGHMVNMVVGSNGDIWVEVIPSVGDTRKIPIFARDRLAAIQMFCWEVGVKDYSVSPVGDDAMVLVNNELDMIMTIDFKGKAPSEPKPMSSEAMNIQLFDLSDDTYSSRMGHVLQIKNVMGGIEEEVDGKSFRDLAGSLTNTWKFVNFEGTTVKARCLRVSDLVRLWDSVTTALEEE